MPFFHYQTLKDIDRWRDPAKVDIEVKRITEGWDFCLSESPEPFGVHIPLTLDEYCSPVLPKSVLDKRNRDQVLLKAKRAELMKLKDKLPPETHLLAVSQMWLWELEDVLIISPVRGAPPACDPGTTSERPTDESHEQVEPSSCSITRTARTPKEANPAEEDDTDSAIEAVLTRNLVKASSSVDRMRAIGMMVSDVINFLEHPSGGPTEPILNIYEKYITIVGQRADAYSREHGVAKINIEEERLYLHDIDDIRVELAMIKRVILQQEEVWKNFASNTWPEFWQTGKDERMVIPAEILFKMGSELRKEWVKIVRPQSQFEKYYRRITQLDEDAERVERSILIKLDLKQKHTSLREAHATGVMSAAVLGFTVITIIFTPLSFVTSLFALSIDQFQKNQVDWFVPDNRSEISQSDMTRAYTVNYIGKWAGKWDNLWDMRDSLTM